MCPRDIDQHTRHRQSTAEAIDARVICRVDDRGVTRALIGEQSFAQCQRLLIIVNHEQRRHGREFFVSHRSLCYTQGNANVGWFT